MVSVTTTLREVAAGGFAGDEVGGNDAEGLAAGGHGGGGDRAHEADVAGAVDEAEARPRERRAEFGGGCGVGRLAAGARAAEHADRSARGKTHGQAPDFSVTLCRGRFVTGYEVAGRRAGREPRGPGRDPDRGGPGGWRMGDGSPQRRRTALLALLPLAAIGLLYVATARAAGRPACFGCHRGPAARGADGGARGRRARAPERRAAVGREATPGVRRGAGGAGWIRGGGGDGRARSEGDDLRRPGAAGRGRGGCGRQLRRDLQGRSLAGAAGADARRGDARGGCLAVRGRGDAPAAGAGGAGGRAAAGGGEAAGGACARCAAGERPAGAGRARPGRAAARRRWRRR